MQGIPMLDDLTYRMEVAAAQLNTPSDLPKAEKYKILKEIIQSKQELAIACAQFDMVSDPLLIDHIVFRIGAAERRLSYLLRNAKEMGLAFDGMQWEWAEGRGSNF